MNKNTISIAPQVSDDPLFQYSLEMLNYRPHKSPVDDTLKEMEFIAFKEKIPIVGALEGALIQALVSLKTPKAKYILDIGTAIGYSAIWLGRSIGKDSRVISIEIDPERARRAQYFVDKADLNSKIQIIVGDIFEIIPFKNIHFDVIFQDVIKHQYFSKSPQLAVKLLNACEHNLATNGLLMSDNAYCLGHVLDSPSYDTPNQIIGIQSYNIALASNQSLESVIVPIRDGLWISKKTR